MKMALPQNIMSSIYVIFVDPERNVDCEYFISEVKAKLRCPEIIDYYEEMVRQRANLPDK
jgi:hypothetical protein